MLGWLFPSDCPLEDDLRRWVEGRARWICETFPQVLELPIRLPLREHFPDPFDGTPDAGVALFERVKDYLGFGEHSIRIQFYREGDGLDELRLKYGGRSGGAGTAGQFTHREAWLGGKGPTVRLNEDSLRDQAKLTATLAHELGHYRLLVPTLPGADEGDHEPLTDLLTIFSGFGILISNQIVVSSSSEEGLWSQWSVGRLGYLSAEIAGYALAIYARLRGEAKPAWRKHLDHDPRAYFEQSRRYLEKRFPGGLEPSELADDWRSAGLG